MISQEGPKFGYFPEPSKCYLVVAPEFVEEAAKVFEGYAVNIVTGHKLLGGFIGDELETEKWLQQKINIWINSIKCIARAAVQQPQAAHVALTKSTQNEWGFIQRVVVAKEHSFEPLTNALKNQFLPSLAGFTPDELDSALMMKCANNGGLGTQDPLKTAAISYSISKEGTEILSDAIKSGNKIDIQNHVYTMKAVIANKKKLKQEIEAKEVENIMPLLPIERLFTFKRIYEGECSGWLSIMPLEDNQFDLSPDAFRDAISLRYGHEPVKLQGFCDGCGFAFSKNHALDCKKGGLVSARHNESRDLNIDLCSKAGLKTTCEPVIKDSIEGNDSEVLRVDWGVRGLWESQREALFDICICNADAPSYQGKTIDSVFNAHKDFKRKKYAEAAEHKRASFSPILATCDGVFDFEAKAYTRQLAVLLSKKWSKLYAEVHGWIKARMQI